MLKIITGREPSLYAYGAELAKKSPDAILITAQPHFSRSWECTRQIVAKLRSRLPQAKVADVLAQHSAAATIVLNELDPAWEPAECPARESFAAQLSSHMTHNWTVQYPLFTEWGKIISELIGESNLSIIVPSVAALTWEDAAVLKSLVRHKPIPPPNLILGIDSLLETEIDQDGLIFSIPIIRQKKFIRDLQLISETVVIEDPPSGLETLDKTNTPSARNLDLESLTFATLTSPGPANRDTSGQAYRAVWHAFRGFGFTTALRLGRALIDARPALSDEEEPEIHSIIALSAHNRQFRSDNNSSLAQFIQSHLNAALARESRPLYRCALLYRLAVTLGRRLGRIEEALRITEEALLAVVATAADGIPALLCSYQEAWIRNIRSYLFMRQKRFSEAFEEAKSAFELLQVVVPGVAPSDLREFKDGATMWLRDAKASQSVIGHNLVNLAKMQGKDRREIETLLYQASIPISEIDGSERFEARVWVNFFLEGFRLDAAIKKCSSGLESAKQEQSADLEYYYIARMADICFRLGRLQESIRYFEAALDIRQRCGLRRSISVEILYALANFRAGLLDNAERMLAKLSDDAEIPQDLRGQFLAWSAVTRAAREGKKSGSEIEHLLTSAAGFAQASGSTEMMARVTSISGYAWQLANDLDKAVELYSSVLRMEVGATPYWLLSAVGLQECRDESQALALRSLLVAPSVLTHPETWWLLPRLLSQLEIIGRVSPVVFQSDELAGPLDTVLAAASLRADCSRSVAGLLAQIESCRGVLNEIRPAEDERHVHPR